MPSSRSRRWAKPSPTGWWLITNFARDARWETALRSHCRKLLVIDDLADREHDCDLLLDQNLVADIESRYDGKLPERLHEN